MNDKINDKTCDSHTSNKIMLELFSGNGDISKAFATRGWRTVTIDWSDLVEADFHEDINNIDYYWIIDNIGRIPDVIWASPDCTTYSIATHRHRTLKEGLVPKTELAAMNDRLNWHLWKLIDKCIERNPGMIYFIENPKGRMRHMPFVKGRTRYSVDYCMYGAKGNAKGYEHLYHKNLQTYGRIIHCQTLKRVMILILTVSKILS